MDPTNSKSVFRTQNHFPWIWPSFKLFFVSPEVMTSVFEKLRFRDGLVWTTGLVGRNKPASLNSSAAIKPKAEISKKSCSNVIQIVIYCQKKPHNLSTWHFFVTHLIGTENGPVWARKSMWPTRSSFSCKEKQATFCMFSCAHSIIPLIRCVSPFRTNMKFCCNRVSNIAFFNPASHRYFWLNPASRPTRNAYHDPARLKVQCSA